jgi:serine O-acetyltransferase
MMTEWAHSRTGIDIHPGAAIGSHFFIDHGTGVVIGETAVIGQRVRVYQAVTLGAKRFPRDAAGHLEKGLARHPIVEDDVVIYAGATILGRVTLGRGAVIGGNVWLTQDVAPEGHVTQAVSRREEAQPARALPDAAGSGS